MDDEPIPISLVVPPRAVLHRGGYNKPAFASAVRIAVFASAALHLGDWFQSANGTTWYVAVFASAALHRGFNQRTLVPTGGAVSRRLLTPPFIEAWMLGHNWTRRIYSRGAHQRRSSSRHDAIRMVQRDQHVARCLPAPPSSRPQLVTLGQLEHDRHGAHRRLHRG